MNIKDTLNQLLPLDPNLESPQLAINTTITGITPDSNAVAPGAIFVAIRGNSKDGHEFINLAHEKGAALVVGENPPTQYNGIPYIQVTDSRKALASLAAAFYGNPSHSLLMIGITGTSGKTTTTYLTESILQTAGHKVGVIGTVNFRYAGKIIPSTHTTPGALELQKLLAEMKAAGCTAVVMEVSSHALKQQRIRGVAFDAAVFTNLSPEHLDYHSDMEDYFLSKAILFTDSFRESVKAEKHPIAVINIDDKYGLILNKQVQGAVPFSLQNNSALKIDTNGIHGEIANISIHSKMIGRFNAMNILAALHVTKQLGVKFDISDEHIALGISSLSGVPGRLERVFAPNATHIKDTLVLVDYAHKPDALDKVLKALVEIKANRRIITVFGCGGDRDRTKRPVMGKIAAELSDLVFVTSDNPRTEDPLAIIEEITAGMKSFNNYRVEPDRKEAIILAINEAAKDGDLVLLAGKGHEDYQIIADNSQPGGVKKIHLDDREEAQRALETYYIHSPPT